VSIAKEFREFAVKGNVVDLAVGVIIGGAFGKIVTSVVEDIVMPPLGLVLGKVDFATLYVPLFDKSKLPATGTLSLADAKKLGPVLAYGNFLNNVVQFAILAFVIFLMVKAINKMRTKPEAAQAPAAPPADVQLLTEIRDLLKSNAAK